MTDVRYDFIAEIVEMKGLAALWIGTWLIFQPKEQIGKEMI